MTNRKVSINEVGPRDGLQSEPEILSTASKLEFIGRAVGAGIKRLEVASFVHPKKVPQMADAEALLAQLPLTDDVSYIGLIMNERGLDRALDTPVHEVGMVVVATDTYNRRNQGVSTNESIEAWSKIAGRAKTNGKIANVMISAAFGCPFEGEVSADRMMNSAPSRCDFIYTIRATSDWRTPRRLSMRVSIRLTRVLVESAGVLSLLPRQGIFRLTICCICWIVRKSKPACRSKR